MHDKFHEFKRIVVVFVSIQHHLQLLANWTSTIRSQWSHFTLYTGKQRDWTRRWVYLTCLVPGAFTGKDT